MGTHNDGAQIKLAALGFQTEKTAAVAASGSSADLFSVDGGLVALLGLVGHVETVLPAATDLDVDFDPDDGGTDVVLSTIVEADTAATGTTFALNSTNGGALIETLDIAHNFLLADPILLTNGDIKLTVAGGTGDGGSIHWYAFWLPVDEGAALTAS